MTQSAITMAPEQKLCEECGLPISICNALTSYRLAVNAFKSGRPNIAAGFVEDAEQYHKNYRERQRSGDRKPDAACSLSD